MADANLAEYTKQVSAAGMAMDNDFGRSMQKTYVKVVAFNKLLGPFYNLWLKFKTGVGQLLSPMKALLVPFGIMEKTTDGIKMSFLGLIGILFTVISVFAYLSSSVGSAGGGTDELMASLGGLKDILMGVIQQIMAFDFGPAIDMAMGVLTAFGAYFVSVVTIMIDAISWWLTTWLSIVEAMYDHGVFHALLAVFVGIWAGIRAIFDGFMAAFEGLGISGESVTSSLSAGFASFASFLVSSGIVDFVVTFMETLGLLFEVAGVIIGALIGLVVDLAVSLGESLGESGAGGVFMSFLGIVGDAIDGIMAILNGLLEFSNILLSDLLYIFTAENPFQALAEVAGKKIDWITDKLSKIADGAKSGISDGLAWIENRLQDFLDYCLEIFDKIPDFGDIAEGIGNIGGGIVGGVKGIFSGSGGGIASGPTSGYPAILHGTEAVVPLPDGRSIPVAIGGEGMGGKGTTNITNDNTLNETNITNDNTLNENTVNITVSGANGNPQDIAKAVGKEVQRVFKSRSRSGGYGRGI